MSHARTLSNHWMTADQFMDWPGDGTGRSFQLVDGEPLAMSPPSQVHGIIQANLVTQISIGLRAQQSTCRTVIGPGVRPRPDMAYNVRVPDVAVNCVSIHDRFVDQPTMIAEILSPSNARETREAIRAMLSVPSLQEVLVLGSESITAELFRRGLDQSWPPEPAVYGPGDTLTLQSLGVSLSMSELYEGLGLD